MILTLKYFGLLSLSLFSLCSLAADEMPEPMKPSDGMQHMHMHMQETTDARLSLELSPQMKQQQLANMRSHLEAVQAITGLLAERKFDQAAQIAHGKLGLTDDMKKMCGMFRNKEFEQLGLAFHKSGDDLGDALSSKDLDKSLHALNTTMGYCTQCHATFRQ